MTCLQPGRLIVGYQSAASQGHSSFSIDCEPEPLVLSTSLRFCGCVPAVHKHVRVVQKPLGPSAEIFPPVAEYLKLVEP